MILTWGRTKQVKKESFEMAKRDEKFNIAKDLKRRGLPAKEIAEITGLPVAEVEAMKVRKK